jgi:predicted DNA-binding transcriptional regulator AlpA
MDRSDHRIVRLAELANIKKRTGLLTVGPATTRRCARTRSDFPKPFKLGPATTVWDLREIKRSIANQRVAKVSKRGGEMNIPLTTPVRTVEDEKIDNIGESSGNFCCRARLRRAKKNPEQLMMNVQRKKGAKQ